MKALTIERMGELFIYHLRTLEKAGKGYEYLGHFLVKKKIYFNQQTLVDILNLLETKNFIEKIPDKIRIDNFGKAESIITALNQNFKSAHALYKLSLLGKDFVDSKQKIDLERIKERRENRKKWHERIISLIISIIVFVAGHYITR